LITLNVKGRIRVLETPLVMGILNLTEDSFYAGSRLSGMDAVLAKAEQMIREGADILDFGGQSTRPGATLLGEGLELERLLGPLAAVHERFPEMLLSVDTFYSRVALESVQAGAAMVNDISAGEMDPRMLETVARLRVPYICMHMRGTPATMQQETTYDDLIREILDFFIQKTAECRIRGIHDLILDPGFGFSKTPAQNFELIRNLHVFRILGRPLLIGLSRKSTIYRTLGISPEESLNGTSILHTVALLQGVSVLRVHDVREAKEAIRLCGKVSP
jgi:dihydropteroate synthase